MTVSARWSAGVTCALLLAGCDALSGDAGPARWDLRIEPVPTDRQLEILVEEQSCAGGVSAAGRVVVDVDERGDAVELDVRVRARGGDQTCPGNPRTPHAVELDSPIGERDVVGLRRGLDVGAPTTRPVGIVLARLGSVPTVATDRSVSLDSWVELARRASGAAAESYLPPDESEVEYESESAAVGAAIGRLGLSPAGWHVLRLPTPWSGGSSWWLQFLDGHPVVQISADRRVLGWRAIGTGCADLPADWAPDDSFGDVERLDSLTDADRLDLTDLLADVDGLTSTAGRWMFDDARRCAAWIAVEDVVVEAGATITFTSWFGHWPGGAAGVPVEGVMGIAQDGRGVRLTTDGVELHLEPLATELVWGDVSSPLPCRLDSPFTAEVVEP